ncbi:hypothetical protein QJS66_04550 [Kocuria rhizophila]|nr:hypothetical protein QJS66_04550 [Kocuria rhizophila]
MVEAGVGSGALGRISCWPPWERAACTRSSAVRTARRSRAATHRDHLRRPAATVGAGLGDLAGGLGAAGARLRGPRDPGHARPWEYLVAVATALARAVWWCTWPPCRGSCPRVARGHAGRRPLRRRRRARPWCRAGAVEGLAVADHRMVATTGFLIQSPPPRGRLARLPQSATRPRASTRRRTCRPGPSGTG